MIPYRTTGKNGLNCATDDITTWNDDSFGLILVYVFFPFFNVFINIHDYANYVKVNLRTYHEIKCINVNVPKLNSLV